MKKLLCALLSILMIFSYFPVLCYADTENVVQTEQEVLSKALTEFTQTITQEDIDYCPVARQKWADGKGVELFYCEIYEKFFDNPHPDTEDYYNLTECPYCHEKVHRIYFKSGAFNIFFENAIDTMISPTIFCDSCNEDIYGLSMADVQKVWNNPISSVWAEGPVSESWRHCPTCKKQLTEEDNIGMSISWAGECFLMSGLNFENAVNTYPGQSERQLYVKEKNIEDEKANEQYNPENQTIKKWWQTFWEKIVAFFNNLTYL